ncbi:MAG: DUF4097 domain-containing protein [Ruminococcaceae bacterium]|nr:DUF4097 domain-containing protein [Oscillospiraceae bacterium]
MQLTEQSRRAGRVLLIVIGCLLAAVLIFGILNAFFGDGTLGWFRYRYDGRDYTVGEGTVPHADIKRIELDWIDGSVEIIACDDAFPSLTESADGTLAEAMKVRWKVDENGTLSIKYRKSTWFVGFGIGQANKKLILRIPKSMFADLTALEVETHSADLAISDISAAYFSVETESGDVTAERCHFSRCELESVSGEATFLACDINRFSAELVSGDLTLNVAKCPHHVEIETVSGDVELWMPADSDFTLFYETASGALVSDFSMQTQGDRRVCGTGSASMRIESVSGDVILSQNNDIE